jgi:hypothetical protein
VKDLAKHTDRWAEKGVKAQQRPYYSRKYSAKDLVREAVQGRSPTGYLSTYHPLDADSFTYDEEVEGSTQTRSKTIALPFKQVWQDEEDYTKEVQAMLPKELEFSFKDGNRVISKRTLGNKIPNTLENNVFYGWQSPNTVRFGDAQGGSKYYNNQKGAYEKMFGLMPSKKDGGAVVIPKHYKRN